MHVPSLLSLQPFEILPAAQARQKAQSVLPVLLWNFPPGQLLQWLAELALLPLPYLPVSHAMQKVLLRLVWYLPFGQLLHSF